MKKKFIFVLAAAVAVVACTQERFEAQDNSSAQKPISFRVAMSNITKSYAYTPTTATNGDGSVVWLDMPFIASFYEKDGTPITPSLFYTPSADDINDDGYLVNKEYLKYLSGYWYLGTEGNSIAFPLGDSRLDVLALAYPTSGYLGSSPVFDNFKPAKEYVESWGFTLTGSVEDYLKTFEGLSTTESGPGWAYGLCEDNDNYTKKVHFVGVDTWNDSMDLMYAAANNLKASDFKSGGSKTLTFQHTQAVLIFNIKLAEACDNFCFNNLLFFEPSEKILKQIRDGEAPWSATYWFDDEYISNVEEQITLKTVGTLTIDNSRNKTEARWDLHYLKNYAKTIGKTHFYLNEKASTVSPLNKHVNSFLSSLGSPDGGSTFNATEYHQIAEELLIPEQPKQNFWIYYKVGDNYYISEVNVPRGVWQMGHVYIYNLELNLSTPRFTVQVQEYCDGEAQKYHYEYLSM